MNTRFNSGIVTIPPLAFTEDDANCAYDAWGANCGPGALAGVTGRTLEQVRPHIPMFNERRYTNPSMMFEALRNMDMNWTPRFDKDWPHFGLVRIQWEGPWMRDGVPVAARYRYTHWVGACARTRNDVGIFDINCMNSGGWVSLDNWSAIIVPALVKHPGFNGRWHITHSIEVRA